MGHRTRVACSLVLATAGLAAAGARLGSADPFASCEALMRTAPADPASAACFRDVAMKAELRAEARRRLDGHLAAEPGNPGVLLALANVEAWFDAPRTEDLYRRAIERFRALANPRGIVNAARSLTLYLQRHERLDEASAALDVAEHESTRLGDRELTIGVQTLRARILWKGGIDLGRAYRTLKEVEPEVMAGSSPATKEQLLATLASITRGLGRYHESIDAGRRLAEVGRADHDNWSFAGGLFMEASATMEWIEDGPRDQRADALLALVRTGFDLAVATDNAALEAQFGEMLAVLAPGPDSAAQLARCLEIAAEIDRTDVAAQCRRTRDLQLARTDPEAALASLAASITRARTSGDQETLAYDLVARASVRWRVGPRHRALAETLDALDAIEAIRDRQRDDRVKTLLFASWTPVYLAASGQLLAAGDLAAGFAITERWRARMLLESLDRSLATRGLVPPGPLRDRRDAVLDRISSIQEQLFDARTDPDRQRLLDELTRAEAEEAELREAIADAAPAFAAVRRPRFVTVAELAGALGADEAVVSFQLAAERDLLGDPLGGPWVMIVNRGGAHAYPLAPRADLDTAIEAFVGLLHRRDGSEGPAAAALYRALLGPAEAELSSVRRLVIVADGALHRIPFAALRPAADQPALAERVEITLAPSATLWLRLREQSLAAGVAALALADPELPTTAAASSERGWAASIASTIAPLPHARAEARHVARAVGAGSRTLLGAAASEHALKHVELDDYRILHFATHAVVDGEYPDRSAVLLSPGAANEDGLLQPRDLAGVDLRGRVVVLSACRSATGAIVRGEGVLGLTGAFLQAGAHAVIGSLWPLRDDEAAALFSDLYRHLARGRTLDGAVAAAQRDAIRRGAPTAVWAGVVVVGDGSVSPVAARAVARPRWDRAAWLASAVLTLASVVLVLVLVRRHRR